MLEFDLVTTKGGDKGQSSLYNGDRLPKDDLLFETLGDIDELTSYIGVLKAHLVRKHFLKKLSLIQRDLLVIGSLIATPPHSELFDDLKTLNQKDTEKLEKWEKIIFKAAHLKSEFILPGGTILSSYTDVCRTICRRSERHLVRVINQRHLVHLHESCRYLNRLSDYFFVLARYFDENKKERAR
ncbi:cob(I)yrinic acid a,c-diamide adenosyltransferase [Spirochaeta cellobiosiphila]|uniref:cob(I)yrinic acid a,c-diamide adenosyltransferase n=1 Tax=Spirochaeta cellobiosiphila TaxID=504483 RepID=UPI0003FB196F|nr:cob(I)yrinic acid a,c-diamide adenosyltransferase [Spirochaeta cellobiosiphila]